MNSDMNKRRTKMLLFILKSRGAVSFEDMRQQYACDASLRTIRSDINAINYYLEQNGVPPLAIYRNRTTEFAGDDSQRERALQLLLDQEDFYKYHLDAAERACIILCHLLSAVEPVSPKELCAVLAVSRGTFYTDMERCRALASEYDLVIDSQWGKGYTVDGLEWNKRQALTDLQKKWSESSKDAYQRVKPILLDAEQEYGFIFTDRGFLKMLRYLDITAERIGRGDVIAEIPENIRQTLESDTEPEIGIFIWTRLNEHLNVEYMEAEAWALEYHLRAICRLQSIHSPWNGEKAVRTAASRFLMEVFSTIGMPLVPDRETMMQFLGYVETLGYGLSDNFTHNPYLETMLREEYPVICEAVRANEHIILDFAGRDLSDSERAQLMLFVISVFSNAQERPASLRAVLVCDGDPGEIMYLRNKLCRLFDIEIVDVSATHSFGMRHEPDRVDVVITTAPLETKNYDIVSISSSLTLQDAEKIQGFILKKRYASLFGYKGEGR